MSEPKPVILPPRDLAGEREALLRVVTPWLETKYPGKGFKVKA